MSSLKKIAAELGVSYTLVSKVLSGRMSTTVVSAQKRDAILKKAKELNYTPNRLAVALKAGRKGAVGIFLHQFGSPGSDLTERLLRGLADGLELSGSRMWLRFFKTEKEFVAACDTRLKSEVDGLIVAGVRHPELVPRFRDLEQEKVPVVSIFSDDPEELPPDSTNVVVDYFAQGYLPTKHLLDQGRRRLALFDTLKIRSDGFFQAHLDAGVEVDPRLVIPAASFFLKDGKESLEKLFKLNLSFDGIVCQSDTQGVGAINELVRRGVKVPSDLMVTGVDNSPMAMDCYVPITSVTSEMRTAALTAVDLLLRKIEGETVNAVRIKPRLEVRESTGGSSTMDDPSSPSPA